MIATLLTRTEELRGIILLGGACMSLKEALQYQNFQALNFLHNILFFFCYYIKQSKGGFICLMQNITKIDNFACNKFVSIKAKKPPPSTEDQQQFYKSIYIFLHLWEIISLSRFDQFPLVHQALYEFRVDHADSAAPAVDDILLLNHDGLNIVVRQ